MIEIRCCFRFGTETVIAPNEFKCAGKIIFSATMRDGARCRAR